MILLVYIYIYIIPYTNGNVQFGPKTGLAPEIISMNFWHKLTNNVEFTKWTCPIPYKPRVYTFCVKLMGTWKHSQFLKKKNQRQNIQKYLQAHAQKHRSIIIRAYTSTYLLFVEQF